MSSISIGKNDQSNFDCILDERSIVFMYLLTKPSYFRDRRGIFYLQHPHPHLVLVKMTDACHTGEGSTTGLVPTFFGDSLLARQMGANLDLNHATPSFPSGLWSSRPLLHSDVISNVNNALCCGCRIRGTRFQTECSLGTWQLPCLMRSPSRPSVWWSPSLGVPQASLLWVWSSLSICCPDLG